MGWYSTGPRLREADLDITDLMANYCETPLLVICEVQASITRCRCYIPCLRCCMFEISCMLIKCM